MQLAESIVLLRHLLGKGDKTEGMERRYRIELQALMDVYEGHPFDDSRWNITEGYVYREAWVRGSEQARIEGKGTLNQEVHHADSTRHEQCVPGGSSQGEGSHEGAHGHDTSC